MAQQYGVSGNRPLWGQLQTGEHISSLDGTTGRAIFAEMARSDDRITAVLEARRLPILRNTYRVEPPTEDARDVEIAEFVEDNLFNRMSMSWQDTLRHAMLMDTYGFTVFENLFMRSRDDGKIRLKKLDPRLPTSIQSWYYNGDSLEYIEQIGSDGAVYKLPIESCVVMTRNRVGDNWEGTSALRSVYGLWKIKNQMLKVAAIKHDRFGAGTPVAKAPESVDSNSEAWAAMKTALEDYHANEVGYLILPAGWDVKILIPEGGKGGTDVEGFIKQLDEGIAISLLAQFLNLGTSETGSRSLGQSFIDFFLMAEQETANYICDTLNRFVVQRLVDYNWADVQEYPQLRPAQIRELDYETLGKLKTAGVLTQRGDLENAVRVGLGLPEVDEDEEPLPAPPRAPERKPDDEPPAEDDEEQDPDDVEAHDHGHTHTFAEPPEEVVAFMQFDAMEAALDAAQDELLDQVMRTRTTQVDRLVSEIVAGKAVRNLTVVAKKDMFDDAARAFRAQIRVGREQVREELARQRPGYSLADPVSDDQFVSLVLEELSLLVDGAGEKLKAMIAKLALDLQKTGLSGDALRVELYRRIPEKISDATWRELVGTAVNQGWGHGRNLELVSAGDDVQRYMRLGILDRNLCGVCREKDQLEVSPGDPAFRVPDQECEGGPGRCRCVIVAIMKSEVAA